MLGELPLNAIVCEPAEGETLGAGSVAARGFAVAGGDRRVKRVEVSHDAGKPWGEASLKEEGNQPAVWCLWEVDLKLAPGLPQIVVRATDSAGGTQPIPSERYGTSRATPTPRGTG